MSTAKIVAIVDTSGKTPTITFATTKNEITGSEKALAAKSISTIASSKLLKVLSAQTNNAVTQTETKKQ